MKKYIASASSTAPIKEFEVIKAVTQYYTATVQARNKHEAEVIAESLTDEEWTPPEPNEWDETIRAYTPGKSYE